MNSDSKSKEKRIGSIALAEDIMQRLEHLGHCEDCLMYKCEVASLKGRIEQLEKEKAKLYDRCLENEEAMYDAVIKGNDNHLIELVEEGVNKI